MRAPLGERGKTWRGRISHYRRHHDIRGTVCWRSLGRVKVGATNMVRILLADDHGVVRRGLRALLSARWDFEVCAEARNGREAVELALQHMPDVAVLDITLSLVNGIEATRQIRMEAPRTEVMIFTLRDGESEIRNAIQAGARGYVLKSETDEQVVRAIEAVARHSAFFSDHISPIVFDNFLEQAGREHSDALTPCERKVVQLIAEGNSNKKAAITLGVSVKTVETHRSASMRKLDIHSTAQLVRYAFREGLVQP
jgi:DNA-binding NarL/FixJ family response regulator